MSFLLRGEITTHWGIMSKRNGVAYQGNHRPFFKYKFESTFRTRRVYNILITLPNKILQLSLHGSPQGYKKKKSLKKRKAVL